MKRKIIGVTVGSPLPKPNLMQTDPNKGDYVKGKEEFLKQIGNTPSAGGINFTTDETLTLSEDNVLSVNRAFSVEQDNTLPITSAAVHETVGNINALLATI